jgi:hypothetical protein
MRKSNDFYFNGIPVGIFEGNELPRSPGCYRYEPYRSVGHYLMHQQLEAGNTPRCSYHDGDSHVSFIVQDCSEYGILELRDFEIPSRDRS